MLAIVLLTALLVLRTAPDSMLGKALRHPLVDWPAKRLSRLTRGQIACLFGFALLLWAGLALLGHEAMQVFSLAMPETLAWFAAFDMSVLADALVAAALVATQARFGRMARTIRALIARRPRPRARAPRQRPAARESAANEDDGDRPAFVRFLAA